MNTESRRSADQVQRTLMRATKMVARRPDPPRDLRFAGGILSWKAPRDTSAVTHYRVYADDDQVPAREVSMGQTQIADYMSAANVLVSSYNAITGMESAKVELGAAVSPARQPGTIVQNVSLSSSLTTIEPSETAVDGMSLTVFIEQDATGGRQVTWSSDFKLATVDIDTTPSTVSVFRFTGRSDKKWWLDSMPLLGMAL